MICNTRRHKVFYERVEKKFAWSNEYGGGIERRRDFSFFLP